MFAKLKIKFVIFFIGLVVLPVCAVVLFVLHKMQETTTGKLVQTNAALLSQISSSLIREVETTAYVTDLLAEAPVMRNFVASSNPELRSGPLQYSLRALFESYVKVSPHHGEIALLAPSGDVDIGVAKGMGAALSLNRDLLHDLANWEQARSQMMLLPSAQGNLDLWLFVVRPLRIHPLANSEGKRINAVLVNAVRWDFLKDRLSGLRAGNSGAYMLVDRLDGRILTGPLRPDLMSLNADVLSVLEHSLQTQELAGVSLENSRYRILGRAILDRYILFSLIPERELATGGAALVKLLIPVLLLFLVLLILIVAQVHVFVLSPLGTITALIHKLGQGHGVADSPKIVIAGEFKDLERNILDLAGAFDAMLKREASKDSNFRTQEKQLRHLQFANQVRTEFLETLEHLVTQRTSMVIASREKVQRLLDHVELGICTIDPKLKIEDEFSHFLMKFYGKSKEEIIQTPYDILFPDVSTDTRNMDVLRSTLISMLDEDIAAWDMNSRNLVREATITINAERKHIVIDWSPLATNDIIKAIMVTIRDVTLEKALDKKVKEQSERNEKMLAIVANLADKQRSSVQSFLEDSRKRLDTIRNVPHPAVAEMMSNLHTIKGNSRSFNFVDLKQLAHDAEGELTKVPYHIQAIDRALHQIDRLHQCLAEYERLFNDLFFNDLDGRRASFPSIPELVGQNLKIISQTLRTHGLRVQEIRCQDSFLRWSEETFTAVANIVMHALNNAIDHGFVFPHRRHQATRPIVLGIVAEQVGDDVCIRISDTGAGFDMGAIRSKLEERGISASALSNIEVLSRLLSVSISTAPEVTESSGRGVGLQAVVQTVLGFNGRINLLTNENGGVTLEVYLPQRKLMRKAG